MRRSALRGARSFSALFASGKYRSGRGFSFVHLPAPDSPTQVAVCVGRKTGHATLRNRVRRVVQESLDPLIPEISPGWRLAILPRSNFLETPAARRTTDLRAALDKAGLLKAV